MRKRLREVVELLDLPPQPNDGAAETPAAQGIVGAVGDDELAALLPPELVAERHDLSALASGEPSVDDWLRRRARANLLSGASWTYVRSARRSDHCLLHSRCRRGHRGVRPSAAQLARSDPDGGARPACGRPGLAGQGGRLAAAWLRLAAYLPKRRRSFPCVAFWYVHCRPRRNAFMMATALANRQQTRGCFSSRCRPPPLRYGMYKRKTPVPTPGRLRLCVSGRLTAYRLASAQPRGPPRSSTPIVGDLA